MNKILKLLTAFLVLSLVVSVLPLSSYAAANYDDWLLFTPEEMQDNAALRALKYIGYDVEYLREKGLLYDYRYTSYIIDKQSDKDAVLSDIGYDNAWEFVTGTETVADGATVSRKAPDLELFRSEGMVCSNFVSYYLFNYLPNIEGIDTKPIKNYMDALGNGSQFYHSEKWAEALQNAAAQSEISGVTMYTNAEEGWANLVPGDIILFTKEDKPSEYKHIAIYAGACDMYDDRTNKGLRHYIIHVGNERGPEISTSEYQKNTDPAKSGIPTEFYHLGGITSPLPDPEPEPEPELEYGGFIVEKQSNVSYAYQPFQFNLWRIEEDSSRTHIGQYSIGCSDPYGFGSNRVTFRDLPVGQYVIQEDQTPVDGWTIDSREIFVTARPYDPINYRDGYPIITLTNSMRNDGGMTIRVTKQVPGGAGAELGWKINLYYQEFVGGEWMLIDSLATAKDAADPSCTFTLTEEQLWLLGNDGMDLTGFFIVQEDQTPVAGWALDHTGYTITPTFGGAFEVTVVNSMALGSMTVNKISTAGSPLSGSTMLLEWSADGTVWAPVTFSRTAMLGGCSSESLTDGCLTTGADGKICFTGLHPAAQYRLTELTTPDGYTLLKEAAYLGSLTQQNVVLTVVNGQNYILPAAGVEDTFPTVAIGVVLLICSTFLFVFTNRENIFLKGNKKQ